MNRTDRDLSVRPNPEGLPPLPPDRIRDEREHPGVHAVPPHETEAARVARLEDFSDLGCLTHLTPQDPPPSFHLRSIDELLERDKRREEDGFPRKINVGRLIKPGRGKGERVVIVPTTVEEKLLHDPSFTDQEPSYGGSGEGQPGEVIGEQAVREEQQQSGSGSGQGDGGQHEVESSAYELGRILTERFKLPNLRDKGKRRSLTRYTYDLTDRHRGFGQLLDKKATLRRIIETNIHLGNLPDVDRIDPAGFLVAPQDKVYRILSPEKDYESQALVFFVRDYSGSMEGPSTTVVVSQHVLIYSWLVFQYARQVETRFILHDTQATEVPDFHTYYSSTVAGGTQVGSAYALVNEIVARENLAQDYNIYVFHGTDGDDWDTEGRESVAQLKVMLGYASRVGITVAAHPNTAGSTEVEKYVKTSGLLEEKSHLLRMDVVQDDADEARLIDGIKRLISD
jgi:uncharacterized sporulation protein YeaH/YhbH (DUF444 family)